jgi:hypothetical protein
MNRRDFLAAAGSVTAASVFSTQSLFAEKTTSLYAKGLIIASFEDSQFLRLGFPKASGHRATLDVAPISGKHQNLTMKGNNVIQTADSASGKSKFVIPEVIRMQELYGDSIRSRVTQCPVVLNIPYAAIRNVTAMYLSPTKYAFIRADNGAEIETFRPRKIAATIKIDLSSAGVLKLDGGKTIPLSAVAELHAEHLPEPGSVKDDRDAFADHFHHYMHYMDRPPAADFDVTPKKMGGNSPQLPPVASRFMYWPEFICFLVCL